MRERDTIAEMRADIKSERELLTEREKIVAILAKLPDDDARRRVILAAAALLDIDL